MYIVRCRPRRPASQVGSARTLDRKVQGQKCSTAVSAVAVRNPLRVGSSPTVLPRCQRPRSARSGQHSSSYAPPRAGCRLLRSPRRRTRASPTAASSGFVRSASRSTKRAPGGNVLASRAAAQERRPQCGEGKSPAPSAGMVGQSAEQTGSAVPRWSVGHWPARPRARGQHCGLTPRSSADCPRQAALAAPRPLSILRGPKAPRLTGRVSSNVRPRRVSQWST